MNEAEIQSKSVLEKGMTLDKNGIIANHNLEIRGVIATRLVCSKTVIIDEGSVMNGDIFADEVIVKGSINGNIYAKRTVKLCQNCNVCGKVFYGELEVEKTAILIGSSEKKAVKKLDDLLKSINSVKNTPAKVEPVRVNK